MQWRFFPRSKPTFLGRKMIRAHSMWLSSAVRLRLPVPRIPTRRVSDGGFTNLMETRQGRESAANWWYHALDESSLD